MSIFLYLAQPVFAVNQCALILSADKMSGLSDRLAGTFYVTNEMRDFATSRWGGCTWPLCLRDCVTSACVHCAIIESILFFRVETACKLQTFRTHDIVMLFHACSWPIILTATAWPMPRPTLVSACVACERLKSWRILFLYPTKLVLQFTWPPVFV